MTPTEPGSTSKQPGGQDGHPPARLRGFHELMRHRVRRILLVSSLYDSFIMSEEGQLHETLLSQFLALNLVHFPDLLRVPNCEEALALLAEDATFDLVISSVSTGDSNAAELTRRLREAGHRLPVVALAYTSTELRDFVARHDASLLDRVFLWQGDVRILLAIVKSVEDRLNVANDTGVEGVPAVIVVEDNVRFYSSFLPTIYSELFNHTHRLLSEDLSLSQRMVRMRARPKVLLCTTYEEAWDYFERFEDQVLGVISDFEFPRGGQLEKFAGLDLCTRVLQAKSDIRVVMQSSRPENRDLADQAGASFLLKGSPVLLHDLRDILVERFGFGDFVFRMPDGREIDRAHDLKSLCEKLETVPAESVAYHGARNHFSFWLKARTEYELAERLRPRKVSEFDSVEHLRKHVLDMINASRLDRQRTVIADFDNKNFEPSVSITRMGDGSLGGKARGVAFANRILHGSHVAERFPGVDIASPPSVVLGTDIFDEFLEYEWLRDYAIGPNPDEKILERFLSAPFPRRAIGHLRTFVQRVRYPLAVRSSSLLEDSLAQPFAGVYQTFMLPNNAPDTDARLTQLKQAVKRVYASTFSRRAKDYLSMTAFRLEEEKMAVMIQQLVGTPHQSRFYPDFSGVARSHNFYPEPGHRAEDGVVAVALGMGRAVVDGSPCLRFCPRYPRRMVGFSSVSDALENSQREFYALDLSHSGHDPDGVSERRLPLEVAEQDGPLAWLGSTYTADDNRIVDGISRAGVRLVSFAQVLKHDAFPLAEIVNVLLEECERGTGAPVEIEFAGNLGGGDRKPQFAFLQLRPLAMSKELDEVDLSDVDERLLLCRSRKVLGNGRMDDLYDVIVVDIERFERHKSHMVALQVAQLDGALRKEERPYLLVGVGRWGSADPNLGIPVTWNQIAGARVIVEAGFRDMRVEPSQGTHFFQNLSSSGVGYFTVNPDVDDGYLDWGWLAGVEARSETDYVRHLRLPEPLIVKISGRTGEGVILQPGAERAVPEAASAGRARES